MKAKKLFLIALPLMVAAISLMTSCSSDDDDILSKTDNKGYTVFSAVAPGSPETRTLIGKYKDGKGFPFYWGDGDMIYVKDDNNIWQESEPLSIPEYIWGKPTANFNVPGKFSPDKTYEVRYFGRKVESGTMHGSDWGMLPQAYFQYGINYSDAIKSGGDCGVGTAIWKNGHYTFKLQHKLAYLCLLPYTPNKQDKSWDYMLEYVQVSAVNTRLNGRYELREGKLVLSQTGFSLPIQVFTKYPGQPFEGKRGISVATTEPNPDKVAIFVPIFPDKHILKIKFFQTLINSNAYNSTNLELPENVYEPGKVYKVPCPLKSVGPVN